MPRIRTSLFLFALLALLVAGCTSVPKKSPPLSGSAQFYKLLDQNQRMGYKADLYYHYMAGHLAITQNDGPRTLNHFAHAVQSDEDSVELQLIAATLNLQFGRIEPAIEHANKALELEPENLQAALLLGGLYTAQGKIDLAIEHYESALTIHPGSERLALFLAGVYLSEKQVRKAERLLLRTVRNHPDSMVGNFELGRIYLLDDAYDKALKYLNTAVVLEPSFPKAHLAIGYALEAQGDKTGALESFKKVLELTPENNELRNHVIALMLSINDSAGAIEQNERLKFFQYDPVTVHYNRAMILFQQEQFAEAAEQLEIVLGKEPANSAALYFLANCHVKLRSYDMALAKFGQIPNDDRLYPSAVEARAYVLRRLGRLPEARELLMEAIAIHPEATGLHRVLGLVYSTLERHEKAEEHLKIAIALDPEDGDLVYTLANVYEKAGKYEKGIRLMEKVLEADPNSVDALNYLGYTLADHNEQLEKSLEYVQRAQKLRPNDGFITDSVGWVLFKLGRMEQAVAQLEKAVELVPDEPVILEHLGDAYREVGRDQDALRTYIRARESHPEPDQIDRLLQKIEELGG